MAVQHTDTNFHNLDFFADSYEDIDVSSSAEFTSKAKETDICTFNGDFDIQDTDKSIKYYLMQGDKIKDTKQVDITKSGKNGIDGTDGEKGDTGITVTIEPNSLDLTPDRSGAVADEVTTRFDINAYQNSSLVEISGVTLINEIPKDEEDNPYYEVTIDLDSGKNARIALTVKKGFMFDSPTDTIYKLNFLVVTNTGDSIETAYILKKVSKGTSLGRINYVPSGRELQNVCYDTDEFNSDGSVKTICVETVYAFIGDLVVNVGSGDEDSIVCDVYRFNGSDWVLVNNDVNACYAAFEDIMSVTESDSAVVQVICKRLVAQTALINNLVAKFVKIKDDGYIRTGAFINPDGSDNDDPQTGGGLLARGNELRVKGKIVADELVVGKQTNTIPQDYVPVPIVVKLNRKINDTSKIYINGNLVSQAIKFSIGNYILVIDKNKFEPKYNIHIVNESSVIELLETLTEEYIIFFYSNEMNSYSNDIKTELIKFGASSKVDTWEDDGYCHLIIGQKGLGDGNGIEYVDDEAFVYTGELYAGDMLSVNHNKKSAISDINNELDNVNYKLNNVCQKKFIIGQGDINFNFYKSVGLYYVNSDMNHWDGDYKWLNAPPIPSSYINSNGLPSGGFSVEVQQIGSSYVQQTFTLYNYQRTFIRRQIFNGEKAVWQSWYEQANISDITTPPSLPDTIITQEEKIYYKVAIPSNRAVSVPSAPTGWVSRKDDVVDAWTQKSDMANSSTSGSTTTDYMIFSCLQYYVNNNDYKTTSVTEDSGSYWDSTKGYLKANLVDIDTLFSKDIFMKRINGRYGKIETYDFENTSGKGFRLDGETGQITCNLMQSSNYSAGIRGWKISSGVSEFNDVIMRGVIYSHSTPFQPIASMMFTVDYTYVDKKKFSGTVNLIDKKNINSASWNSQKPGIITVGLNFPSINVNKYGGKTYLNLFIVGHASSNKSDPYKNPLFVTYKYIDPVVNSEISSSTWSPGSIDILFSDNNNDQLIDPECGQIFFFQ